MVNAPDVIAAAIGCSRAGTWLFEDGANGAIEQTGHVVAVETRSHALTGTER